MHIRYVFCIKEMQNEHQQNNNNLPLALTFVVGSNKALATSSTYRVKFNVLIALLGNSISFGVGY